MLKSIKLTNFQSHADTTIEFSQHVTAIVGLNNHGKSSIFRACRKVLRDYPDGTLFIREKQKQCSIELTTDSGVIERIVRNDKAADSNVYKVDGVQFTKFGKTGIPLEVLEKTRVSPIQKFGDIEFDINFQHQLDPLFLISGDGLASVRGKVIGRVSGVDYAERAVQLASSDIKSIARDIDQTIADIDQNEKKLDQYKTVPELIETLIWIDSLQEKQDDADREIDHLMDIQNDLSNIIAEAHTIKGVIGLLESDVDSTYQEIRKLEDSIKSIEYCINIEKQMYIADKISLFTEPTLNDVEWYRGMVTLVEIAISARGNLEILNRVDEVVLPDIQPLEAANNKVELLCKLKVEYLLSKASYGTVGDIVESIGEGLIKEEQNFEKLKQELGVCPLCDRPFDSEH